MKNEADTPENFSLIVKNEIAHIERNFVFGKDEVSFKVGVSLKDNPDMGIIQMHRASVQTVLTYLQELLSHTDAKK